MASAYTSDPERAAYFSKKQIDAFADEAAHALALATPADPPRFLLKFVQGYKATKETEVKAANAFENNRVAVLDKLVTDFYLKMPTDPIAFAAEWLGNYKEDYDPKNLGEVEYRLRPGHPMFYVGAFDPGLRVFDIIMETAKGTSYNSYLLKGRTHNVLFETVKSTTTGARSPWDDTFWDQMMRRINHLMKPGERLDYIVCNHTEPDHSGSVVRLLQEVYPEATLVATPAGITNVEAIGNWTGFKRMPIDKQGISLDVGGYTLKFIVAPFLHWPDSMFTYIPEMETLVTCDVFGAHFADPQVFDDALPAGKEEEAYIKLMKYYYDCIFGPMKPWVREGLEKIKGLSIKCIACSHGLVVRKRVEMFKQLYYDWSPPQVLEDEVIIAFASAYGYTKEMAHYISLGVRQQGLKCTIYNLVDTDVATVKGHMGKAKGILLGTPTLVSDAIPPIWELALALNPYFCKEQYAAAFGSYGWSGEGVDNITQRLKQVRIKMPVEPLKIKFRASEVDRNACLAWGAEFTKAITGGVPPDSFFAGPSPPPSQPAESPLTADPERHAYFQQKNVPAFINDAAHALALNTPADPPSFLRKFVSEYKAVKQTETQAMQAFKDTKPAVLDKLVADLYLQMPEDPVAFAAKWLEKYHEDYDPKTLGKVEYQLRPGHPMFYVGAFDPGLRVFDIIMETARGTSYNSYLLKGSKHNVLFETVKSTTTGARSPYDDTFWDQMMRRIKHLMKPGETLDYIVCNHTEPDHSGSVVRLLQDVYPEATLVATPAGITNVEAIGNWTGFKRMPIDKQGLTLDVGGYTLKFIVAPFLHWPDSMFTYIPEMETLVTCDVFGAHLADPEVFDDTLPAGKAEEAYLKLMKYYYDCIFGPMKPWVREGLEKIKGLSIKCIACSHGLVVRKRVEMFKQLYYDWSAPQQLDNEVIIAFASAYGYTKEMAQYIAQGVRQQRLKCTVYDLVEADFGAVKAHMGRAKGILLGTPTLLSDAIPPIWQLALGLNPYFCKEQYAASFGSYGWSGEGVDNIDDRLKQVRIQRPVPPLKVKFRASEADRFACIDWGSKFGAAINEGLKG